MADSQGTGGQTGSFRRFVPQRWGHDEDIDVSSKILEPWRIESWIHEARGVLRCDGCYDERTKGLDSLERGGSERGEDFLKCTMLDAL